MKIKFKRKKYKVLEIIHKDHREHDLFICEVIPFGYKECFQRIDFTLQYNKRWIIDD